MRTVWITSCLLISYMSLLCIGCNRAPEAPAEVETETQSPQPELVVRPEAPSQHFAGSQSCQECHEQIVSLFAKHPMGMSAGNLATGPVLEGYESAHFLAGHRLAYSATRQEDGTVIHREELKPRPTQQQKEGGNPSQANESVYQLDHQVDYYLGSGQRGRSYLLQKDGLLFQSPMTWYSTSNRWDLSPGYLLKNQHFERRIVDGCVTCHVGRVATDPNGHVNRFGVSTLQSDDESTPSESPASQKGFMIEAAISCERCHGPAADHVAYQQGESGKGSSKKDPILLISALNSRQKESLCNQCHLIGENRILRYGRSEYDFRPGDDLSDIWVTFVKGIGVHGNQTEAVSHVQQMHSSVCYQKSGAQMDCTSCHGPHSVPGQDQRITFYRNKCLDCHANEQPECSMPLSNRKLQSPEDSCISCHMPALAASDVPHTSQTDHRVLRNPITEQPVSQQDKNQKLVIYDEAEKRLPGLATNRAKALLMSIYAQRDNDAYLAKTASEKLEPLLKSYPNDTQLLLRLGILERMYGSKSKAKVFLEQVLEINPHQEDALLQLGLLNHELQDYPKGVEYLERYLEINPWNRDATGRQIHMLGLTGKFQLGIQKAEKALIKFPGNYQIHGWLVDAYQKVNRLEDAKNQARIYEQVKPDHLK